MPIPDMPETEAGAHHCTRENISYQIAHLKDLAENTEKIQLQDWATNCSVLALQLEWLLAHIDS